MRKRNDTKDVFTFGKSGIHEKDILIFFILDDKLSIRYFCCDDLHTNYAFFCNAVDIKHVPICICHRSCRIYTGAASVLIVHCDAFNIREYAVCCRHLADCYALYTRYWQLIADIQLAIFVHFEILLFRIQRRTGRRCLFYHVVNARLQPSVLGAIACFDIAQLGAAFTIFVQADVLGNHCAVLGIEVNHRTSQCVAVLVDLFQLDLRTGFCIDNERILRAGDRTNDIRGWCQNRINSHVVCINAHAVRRQGLIIKALGSRDGSSVQFPGITALFQGIGFAVNSKFLFHDLIAGRNIAHLNGILFCYTAVRLFAVSAQGIHGDGYILWNKHICCSTQQLIFFLVIEIIPHIGFLIAAGRSTLRNIIALGNCARMIQVFAKGELGKAFMLAAAHRNRRCYRESIICRIINCNLSAVQFVAVCLFVFVLDDINGVASVNTEKADRALVRTIAKFQTAFK